MAALALAWALSAAPALGALVDFFEAEAAQEAMLSEMTTHPAALRVGSVTYIAYQGPGFDPYVAGWDSASGRWLGPYRAGVKPNPLVLDSHGGPAMFVDAFERIHIVYGSHNSSMLHAVTTQPRGIDAWAQLPAVDTGTYPQAIPAGGGTAMLFYRSNDHGWRMKVSDAAGGFSSAYEQVLVGDSGTWWYADFRGGSGGTVHAAYVWVDNGLRAREGPFARFDAHYMRRGADGAWRTAEGERLALPVDLGRADATRIHESGGALVNEITVEEDDEGLPCVLFLTGGGSGPGAFAWRFMRFDDSRWTSATIAATDHFFDSGAFATSPGGRVEAFLVTGDSGAVGGDGDYRGRGGRLTRWLSFDRGATWYQDSAQISPEETATAFASPQFVRGGQGDARLVFTDWSNDLTDCFRRVYLWGDSGRVWRETPGRIERIAGKDRIGTSVAVSRRAFHERAPAVVIATSRDFPDALTAAPLAAAMQAPILLSQPGGLSSAVLAEISRLRPATVVLVGGERALSPAIETRLRSMSFVKSVERLAGSNRYDTALLVADRLYDPTAPPSKAVVVSGLDWPDAASAAPLAASMRWPILLAGSRGLGANCLRRLDDWGARALIVGGTRAVPRVVESQAPGAERIAGDGRYQTSGLLAEYGAGYGYLPYRFTVATGKRFPDSLTGATLAARVRGPMLLTPPGGLPLPAKQWASANSGRIVGVFILGQEAAVSQTVESQLRTYVR